MFNNLSDITFAGPYGVNEGVLVWLMITSILMLVGPALAGLVILLFNEKSRRRIAPMSELASAENVPSEDLDKKRAA